jgi:hypothetical protein
MRQLLTSIFLLVLSLSANAQAPRPTEQLILDLSKKKFDWIVNKKYDSLNVVMDDRIQYVHSNGWVQNKQEVVDDLKSGKLNYQKVTIKDAVARAYPTTVIVLGLGIFEGINQGNPFSMELRYTEVYVKTGSRWKLASRHANRMP